MPEPDSNTLLADSLDKLRRQMSLWMSLVCLILVAGFVSLHARPEQTQSTAIPVVTPHVSQTTTVAPSKGPLEHAIDNIQIQRQREKDKADATKPILH